eukprot:CAMPEP_0202688436 /NCGR_PEP_ID=MMETSP1385-20130828/3960_1 /ASSEMBLY_ACC=CAM_ASM_000861 /TAXON_ID=933848 /ORGANISM="Elphidium margaritaceum" /LENGTH=52 /DNA_ID=CAMNT_0049343421 /DNA_START=418 /DNA_END=576 /DNA_ORIENTATION=+
MTNWSQQMEIDAFHAAVYVVDSIRCTTVVRLQASAVIVSEVPVEIYLTAPAA